MKIDVLTIFPDLFEAVLKWGVISRAIESGLIDSVRSISGISRTIVTERRTIIHLAVVVAL
jgi:tRNA G37 N-methylase TrmD